MSSPILADGKVIVPAQPGGSQEEGGCHLFMFKATPEKYILLGKFNPYVMSCTSPAIAGGKLYVRLWDGVACYDLTAP